VNVSSPFIRRPVATTLLSLALFLAGAVGYRLLPVAPLPQIDLPTVNVQALLPGASPVTMASSVATPLERRFGRIAGLTEMTSTSTLGATNITLLFDLDRSVDAAARDVQAAINAAGGDLPITLNTRPTYRKVNLSDAPILILALTSETLRIGELYDAANSILAQKISQVPGVGQVFVGGGQSPAVRVQVDPEALAGVGLTLEDVRTTLAQSSVDSPKGAVTGGQLLHTIAATDQLLTADRYGDLILAYRNGGPVRLGDVGRAVEDVENVQIAAWLETERAILLIVRRQPGANIIEVNERVKALLPELGRSISPAARISVVSDRSRTIRASVVDVEWTLVFSTVLVVLVVYLFLHSGAATLIPSMAVPLSLVGTFAVMYLLGYSLDNLSLMALTISTGFVIDDAIVVTENVTRLVERGQARLGAAIDGSRQIGFTIISITASLLAVFIPILLMGGIIGRLLREFAVTLSVAIALSAIISLTLTPMMCSRLLGRGPRPGRLGRAAARAFDRLAAAYARRLEWVLDHRAGVLALTLGTVLFSGLLYVKVPKGLFPQQDTGTLIGFTDAPQDISFSAMRARQDALNRVVLGDPSVRHAVSFIGGGLGSTINTGTMFIDLKDLDERDLAADKIIARMHRAVRGVPGIALHLQAVQDLRMGGRFTRTQYQYTLQDADLDELNRWAPRVLDALRKVTELRDVASDQQTAGLELSVAIDRDAVARVGLVPAGPAAIDNALYDAFGQRQVTTLFTQLNQYHVVLEVRPELQRFPEGLRHVYANAPGGPVPLTALTRTSTSTTPLSINHEGQFPSVTLSFNLAERASLGQAVAAVDRAVREIGLPASVGTNFAGTAQVFRDSLSSMPLLLLAALLAVYIVLGVLYESYLHPVTILSTLPSAGVGALLALLLFRTDFSVIAFIGIVLLIGIVKKNAIMMIDFAIEAERDRGLTPRQSITEACLLRFRPILMTTMAALLGGLPLALSHGTGSELRRPLGITIVGGLLVSQLLTLFSTPVVYLTLDRRRRR
jgi:hydrophobe/amphiphile efflux-1 (HAE1) family protein